MIGRLAWVATLALAVLASPTGAGVQAGALRAIPHGAPVFTAGNGTVLLRGSLRSTSTITMRGAFSVGHAQNLSWDLLRATGMRVGGYHEKVLSETFSFNVQPDSSQDLTVDGTPVRRFTWNRPPANTVITVTVRRVIRVLSPLKKFKNSASYPLSSVPSDVQPYLQITPSLKLSSSQGAFVRRLVGHQTSEKMVVKKVANWVASHMRYDASLVNGPYDASWVLTHRRGTCQGYASLMAGMLRTLGVPSQVVYGWVSSAPITVRSGRASEAIEWAQRGTPGAFHDWLNVYFPGTGWVSFDPQREKYFSDIRHYALLRQVDASDPTMGRWTADTVQGQSATGRSLPNGIYEAVPEDGSYTPRESQHDSLQLHVHSVIHDVKAVTLFAR